MNLLVVCGVVFCSLVQAAPVGAQRDAQSCSVYPVGLGCEYLRAPLGIDVDRPRLSWKLKACNPTDRGQRQRAYHVLVASSRDLLEQDSGDLWDSGVVESDQSVHVVYAGKDLQSGMECFWKVRARDEKGTLSDWSEPSRWTMGLLAQSDWKGRWIGADELFERKEGWPPPDNTVPDPWFRKTFDLPRKPARAVIHVASIGYHELYVNGRRIGDAVLSPSATNHRKRARYVTYDITDELTSGRNVIGLWLGLSWSIFPHYKTPDKPQTPIVIAQAEIDPGTEGQVRIVTDKTWKTHPSPNTLLGVWDFMHFGGEMYDARKELPAWCGIDLDDSNWKAATVYTPKVVLSAEMIEPNRRIKKITPEKITKVSENTWRIDLGVNMTGWFEMDLAGEPGDVIDFKFSERPDKDMTHRLYSRYIIGPKGKGTFANRFNYFTGRWVQVQGPKYKPTLDQIRCFMVRTDFKRAAEFECSNKLLNDIYATTLWTFENLSLGGYVVDCAHRERMGYGGDGHATTETGLDNYALGAFYTKWSQDWRDVQGKTSVWGTDQELTENADEGNLPYTAPTYWGGGGPAWSGFCITLPWEVYEQYGDVRILRDNFTTMQRWLAFLETKSKDDMLVRWGGKWDFLGDWLWPGAEGVNGDTRQTLFFNNCYWIYNLKTAAKIARVLDQSDLAEKYSARAQQVRRAVHKEFFDPEENGYVDNSQAYLAIALLTELPPEDIGAKVWKRFEDEILVHRKGHFWGGITGGYFITKTLLQHDRCDLMFEMVSKDTYPGWGDMLNKGATTIWEAWDGHNSLLHSSYLYVGAWFVEGLAGIRTGPSAGFKEFVVKPGIVNSESLKWAKAKYESIYGTIRSEWKIERRQIRLNVTVPPNTSAIIYVPTGDKQSIRENGKPLSRTRGVELIGDEAGYVLVRAGPGSYRFQAKSPLTK